MILYLLTTALLLPLDPPPATEPKPVPATRTEVKEALEAHKHARPRLPMPPLDPNAAPTVNNGRFRNYYLGKELNGGAFPREPDPAMTLGSTLRVKLFWVASRANNCYYCLGHQEHKLAAAGVSDDDIAKLDGDTTELDRAEGAAVEFSRKLTFAPHTLTDADHDALLVHYTPAQVAEIVIAVAGYNAMNRWTDGLNIPADSDGEFFRKGAKAEKSVDLSTFRTPTSPKFADLPSKGAAPLPEKCAKASAPNWPARPPLEDRAAFEAALAAARTRTPRLPLATADAARQLAPQLGDAPGWARFLAAFPVAMKGRAQATIACEEKGKLSPRLKASIAYVCAREDRAVYAADLAARRLRALGVSDADIDGLGGDSPQNQGEAAVLAFARKLAGAPATVTDADVEALRKLHPDAEVAEIVHHVCQAAFFDRVTEAARLPLEPASR